MGLAEIILVISLVDAHIIVIDLEDPVRQQAQEVAVVADQNDGLAETRQDFPRFDPSGNGETGILGGNTDASS